MRRKGFSLIEIIFAVAIAALVVGLSLVNLKRPREGAESRGVAEAVAEELRLARLSAMSRHIPVAVGFPSGNGSSAITRGLYVLEGDEKPKLTRSMRFSGDFPGAVIAQAFWPLDASQMHDPGLGNTTAPVLSNSSSDNLNAATWVPAAYARDTLFLFTPSGAVRSNGAVHFDGAYHILVSEGIEAANGDPGGGGTLAYCTPSRVCQPYTINLSLSGQISVTSGVTAGRIPEASGRIATAPGPLPPALAILPNAAPTIVGIDTGPKNSDTLPGGVNVMIPLDGHVTLRTRATDPNGDALFCEWQEDSGKGTFSSPTQDRMEWDETLGCWVSNWEWRPDSTLGVSSDARLTCRVRDRSMSALAAVSSGTINVRIGTGGRVVFTSYNEDYYSDIAMVNLDGSGERLLTNTPEDDELYPSFSPDGKRIAYGAWDPNTGSMELWVMNYDGTGQHQLTNTPDYDEYGPFVWSPDGTRLATEGDDWVTGESVIFVLAADGSSTQIVSAPGLNSATWYWSPTWSRDGRALVYSSDVGLFWSDLNGNAQRILPAPDLDTWFDTPAWSPVSNTVVFVKSDMADDELYLIDVDPASGTATNMRALFNPTHAATWEYWPSYNPSGTMITYEDDIGVSVTSATGGASTAILPSGAGYAYSPAWTPQGNVVFASDLGNKPDGGMDIYHSNPDGSSLKRLTSNKGDNEITLQPASVR